MIPRRKTPGRQAHYLTHRRIARARRRPADPPEPSGSAITPGSSAHRSDMYPRASDATYLDDALHRYLDTGAEAALAAALIALAVYNPVLCDVVNAVCLRGRATFTLDGGIRHYDWRPAARLIAPGRAADELDDRTVNDWLTRGWEMIGLLLLDAAEQAMAIARHDESRDAADRLRKAGLL